MSEAYIELGLEHILDPKGLDHVLFVVALCAVYLLSDWKKVLVLVTAFTIGHSLTLALASLDMISVSADLVETMIPITILLTCLYNVYIAATSYDTHDVRSYATDSREDVLDEQYNPPASVIKKEKGSQISANYAIALIFGLIHGLGFSNFFKVMLGRDESIVKPLLSFNVGVEIGQIAIVMATLLLSFFLVNVLRLPRKYYSAGLSILIGIWALQMILW